MHIEFKQLNEINTSEIIALMNHPLVRKHMPLAKGVFDEDACRDFLLTKQKLWQEQGDADLALVLHLHHWGLGRAIYQQIIERALGTFAFSSMTVLFPPTRTRIKGLLRLGFKPDGELLIEGERFIRYRLSQILFR